jgi:hypothetical protein
MPGWKDRLSRLSDKEARQREAAFEAAALVELTKHAAPPAPGSPPPPGVQPAESFDAAITVTDQGRTVTYPSLAAVPLDLRQRIIEIWHRHPTP